MNYSPRHAQPFTVAEAMHFDVGTITEEIARLQLSLQHLRRTQDDLKEAINNSGEGEQPDRDLEQAFEENRVVIASQEERISMLKTVLVDKGISTASSHYDLPSAQSFASPPSIPATQPRPQRRTGGGFAAARFEDDDFAEAGGEDEDEGIHL